VQRDCHGEGFRLPWLGEDRRLDASRQHGGG
jgi:hypothetical protein